MNKNLLIIFCCISADVGFAGFVKGPEYPEDYEGPQGYDFTKDPWVNKDLQDEKWFANKAKQRMDARKLPEWMKPVDLRNLCSGYKKTKQEKQNIFKLLSSVTVTITFTITITITITVNSNNSSSSP